MAISNFAVTAPNLAQYSALSELKPLSFAGGMQSPLEFRTMSAIRPPDAQPELVAQGIGKALGSVGEGITAAFKSKAEEKKGQRELARDVIKLNTSRQEKQDALNETIRHNKEIERVSQDRIKGVMPQDWGDGSYKTTSADSSVEAPKPPTINPASLPTPDRHERDAPMGKNPFESINLPEIPEEDPTLMKTDRILGDLTAPMPPEAAPTPMGSNAMNALTNVDWSSVRANLGAGTGAGATQVDIPATQSSFYSAKPPTSINALGGISNTGISNIEKQLAAMPLQALAPIPTQQTAPKASVPRNGFNTYEEARAYMESQSDNPNWYASGTPEPNKQGKFVIPWKQNDPEMRAARKAKASEFADLGKGRLDLRKRNLEIQTFNQSVDKFNVDPSLKKAKEKLKPVIETFMGDLTELNRMGDKYGNRSILDQSLIDQYVRFATGNVPTHNQYEMLTENRPLFDKLKTFAFKKVPASSTSLLTAEERKQMANSMVKVLNMEHQGLNTKVENSRRITDKLKNANIDESNKPHNFPILKTDEDVEKEVSMAVKEMEKAWGGADSKTAKDPEAYKMAIQKHKKALADYEIAKRGVPSNLNDLAKYGEEIDGTYYPAGWSGRLIYEDETAYRPFQNAPVPNGNGE